METYTARELAGAAGVTPAMLDYWARTRLVVPDGDGYTARSVALGIVLAEAANLGASGPTLARLVAHLDGQPVDWPRSLWITARGDVSTVDEAPASIVVHVHRVLRAAASRMIPALSAA